MIFYFTGTGNSLWVAKALSEALGEPLISIADELHKEKKDLIYQVRPDEKILFVYPVHSWGPAVPVTRFISRLTLNGYAGQPVCSVSTCGDECGYTDRLIGKALGKRAISLTAAYSVIMPNNYILLPGFDVDDKEVEERKLQEAPVRVAGIIDAIREHRPDALYHTGSMPGLKSYWIYPLFARMHVFPVGYANGSVRPERSACRQGSLFGRILVCSVSLASTAVRFVRSNMERERRKRDGIIILRLNNKQNR